MKKIKFLLIACMAVWMASSFTACSNDPNEGNNGNNNGNTDLNYHFDLFFERRKAWWHEPRRRYHCPQRIRPECRG